MLLDIFNLVYNEIIQIITLKTYTTQNEIHCNKDDSRIFIRMFSIAEGRQIDDAFDGVLLVHPGDKNFEFEHAKCLPVSDIKLNNLYLLLSLFLLNRHPEKEIIFHVPTTALQTENSSALRTQFRTSLRQAFSKFSASG